MPPHCAPAPMARSSLQERSRLDVAQLTIKGSFESGSFSELRTTLQDTLHALEHTFVNVGVTGEQGSGKTTLINALRDLGEDEEGAAPVGWTEAGREPTAYPYPKHPNVLLWDLPSVGAPDFQPQAFLDRLGVPRYDFFLLLTDQRFAPCHAAVAQGMAEAGKGCFFVRAQVDAFLALAGDALPSGFNEAAVLQRVRESCERKLRVAGMATPRVFLLSSFLPRKYDFPHLQESLAKALEPRKRRAFLLAVPNTSHRLLEAKKASVLEDLWLVSVVATSFNADPVPELSIACDRDFLLRTLRGCCVAFGLDEDALWKVADQIEEPFSELRALVRSPLAAEVGPETVRRLLEEAARKAPHVPREVLSSAAIKDAVAALGLSFPVVHHMLADFVGEAAADAHRVLVKAFVSQPLRSPSEAETSVTDTSTIDSSRGRKSSSGSD